MIDVTQEINAIRRTVGSRVLEAGEARTVTIARSYDAPVEDVWEACTNPERIARWFLPVSGDLGEGGRYALEGNASGTIERCDPPRSFFATWEFGGGVSWIELRLEATEDGTRFELDHLALASDLEHMERYGPGAVGVGWDLGLTGLGRHLATGATIDPAEGAAWTASDEGRRFIALSSEAWGRAAIAAGDDDAEARAAAARTTAFFTGAEEPA